MTLSEFQDSLSSDVPPASFGLSLQALWHEAKGNWDHAHELAQQADSKDGDWVHAYLHRKEGDEGNASYWYSRAGKSKPRLSLEDEWKEMVNALLDQK
jgi:hypothetical protein